MSREVDQRVVEMRFDNAEFEKNTKQSIRTIDRLMEKLQFKDAEKGFEKLDAAAKDVDFDTMARSLDTLEGKFSAFNIMATTALVNITNKMVDAGEKMVKSLSIDQVTAGWNKYAQKTASVQTIMNATGKSITKVNGYLDKLMWFSDETSYGFTDMTAALSTLTSAGGDIEKMIPMIMGMANATAYAGKGAAEFQRVIYNLAQSYGTGAIQLIDWKSVEQAGVASQQLKQMIIDTAVDLGKIKKGEVTTGSFDNSLQKKWADTDVMEAAFGKFAEFSEAVKKRVDANPGMLASQAIEDLADQYDEVTVKAFKAAQEAKSFSEAVDATKDAVSSGWMETFDILFGNYEEAKGFWSDLAEEFWNMFAGGAAGRNNWLKSAFNSGLDQLLDTEGFTDAADSYTNLLQKALVKQGLLTEEGIADAGSFQKALEESGVTAEQLYDVIGGAAAKYASLNALSDAELKKRNIDRDKVKALAEAYADMAAKIQNGSVNLDEFADKMNTLSGREHFFAGILNILESINSVLSPIREAFGEVFMVDGSPLYNLLKGFDEATGKLALSEETGAKLERIFAGIFSIFKMGLSIVSSVGSGIATVFTALLPAGSSLLDILANVGDYFVELEKSSGIAETIAKVFGTLSYITAMAADGIREVIGWIGEFGAKAFAVFDPIKTFGGWIESFVDFITPKVKWLADSIGKIFEELGKGASGAFGNLNSNAVWGFVNTGMIAGLIASIKGFLKAFKDIGSTIKGAVGSVTELLKSLGEAITAWKNNKNAETLKTIASAVAVLAGSLVVLSMINPERLGTAVAATIALFAELLTALAIFDKITKETKKVGKGTRAMVVMAAGVLVLASALKKISEIETGKLVSSVAALGAVMVELVTAQVAISKWAADGAKHAMSMLVMAAAVKVLAGAVEKLGDLEWDEIGRGLAAVGGLLAEVAAFSALSNFGGLTAGKAVGILILASALSVLEKSVSAFSKMPAAELQTGLGALGGILAEIAIFNMLSNSAGHVIATATAFTILSSGLTVLSSAMKSLGGMSWDEIGRALTALAGGLIEVGTALTFVKGALGSAAAFLIISVALNALVPPLKSLGDMSLEEIGHGLLALGGALGVFAVTVGVMSLAGPIVIAVSAALSLLAGSFALLLGAMAAVSLMPLKIEVLVAAIGSLGAAIGVFIAGVIAGLGSAIGGIATAIAEIIVAVCNAIAAAAPAIGNALAALITALCDVLIECSPKIVETLKVLIQSVIDLIGWAWNGEGGDGGGIKGALEELWTQFVDWLGEKASGIGELLAEKLNPKNMFTIREGSLLDMLFSSAQKAADERDAAEYGEDIGGYTAQGFANGVTAPGILETVGNAVVSMCNVAQTHFRDYWGIHSPSKLMETLGEYLPEGFKNGLTGTEGTAAVGDGVSGMIDTASSWLDKLFPGLLSKAKNYGNQLQNALTGDKQYQGNPDFESWYENEISKYRTKPLGGDKSGLTDEDYENEVQIDPTNPKTSTGSTTKKSGTQKTVAQQITEKYKTQLEANKALREAMDSEYELWLTENQYSASEDELLAKKTENAAAEIANQTERVAIAEAKYSEFVKKWGADKTETKQAYASLLSEKTSLAKLKTEQYTNLFEAVTKRYDTDLDTLEAQYNLWTAQNDGTASELDKIRRETEYQTAELEIKQKKEAKAKEQYDTLFAQYGENDLRTKEALNDWLDAQTESLELQNDIAKQGLKEMNARISAIKTSQSRMENRMDLLNTLYEDGSISDRADAYKQAVETYGENSAEAQKAKFQGITTAILGTVSAMQGMTAEMEKYAELAQQLEKMNPNDENYDDVYSQWQDAQKSMVSYAGNLADALGLDANGKKTVMRLARILQKNSSYIESACKTIWDRISEALGPTVSETVTSVFKAISTEDGMEIGTEFISAFASALQGDWAGAVVSALGGVLDLMNTESGQQITAGIAQLFSTALPQIQNGLGGVDKLLNGQGGLASMFGTAMTGIKAAVEGGGGIATVLSGIGTALSGLGASLMAILPEILPFILIFAALAAVVGGLAWFIGSRKKSQKDTVISVKEAGADLDRDYADGIKDRADIVDDAVEEVTEDAWETARSALSTILKKNGDEYDYQPEITPVIDLSDAESAVDWLHANLTDEDSAVQVDFGRSAELAADMMNSLDVKRDAMLKAEESYQKQLSNDDVVTAVSGLGERMDGVAKAIKGMKLTVDGRRAIGYIDEAMGKRTAAIVR